MGVVFHTDLATPFYLNSDRYCKETVGFQLCFHRKKIKTFTSLETDHLTQYFLTFSIIWAFFSDIVNNGLK